MELSTLFRCGTTALKRMNVPRYSSKYSKKVSTVHQHLLVHSVRELEKRTYRGLIDRLEDSKAVDDLLGLKRIPHYATPQKFLRRIPKAWLRILLKRMVDLLTSDYYNAVDATCYRLRRASTHYPKRLGEEEASYFFYGSALIILTTALCFVLIYGCICIGRIESRLLSEEGTAPKCLVESASSMWKKHCASHECEECQEGGMNRPIIRDVKPRP